MKHKNDKIPLILVVDDEKIILDVVSMMLEKIGFEALTAKNGREALEIYKNNRSRIDLVILDMVMPHNGEKTFHDLMALDPDVKVLITSGYAEDHRIRLLIRQGAKGFIQKPFSVNVLKKKILRAIS